MSCKLVKCSIAGVLVVVLLLVILVGVVFVSIDSIAKSAIEKGGTYALGVDTKLNNADIGVLSGKFGLSGLTVRNPEGFDDPNFLELGDANVSVSLSSLMEERVELPELTLDTINITLIKKAGQSNYGVILDNIKKISPEKKDGKGEEPETKPAKEGGKTFVIRQVNINNINVKANMLADAGELTSVSMKIDTIKLEDVGEKDPNVTVDKLTAILMQALISAILEKGTGILPDDILGGLKGGLAELSSLGDMGIDFSSGAAEQIQNLGKNVGDIGQSVGGDVGGALEDAAEGIGGLFGGKKKEDDSKDEKKDDDKK